MKLRSVLYTILAALLLLTGATLIANSAASAAGVFTVYLSPTGSDGNNGLSPDAPLKTLDGAQTVLAAAKPRTDVEVRIAAGTYTATAASRRWLFYVPGHSISFVPATWKHGVPTPLDDRPIFHGPNTGAWWFKAELPDGAPGGDTNLRFYDLIVEHYTAGGMIIAGPMTTDKNGVAVPDSAGLNHNVISGMLFRDEGSVHVPAHPGWGGLDFTNSSYNAITNNQFRRLENSGKDAGMMHGIYLAHGSSHNEVTDNVFQDISDDPVRVRDGSDYNRVHNNTFNHAGVLGYFTDWFCDTKCAAGHRGHPRECASHGNDFDDNTLISGYYRRSIPAFAYYQGDGNYAGGTGCSNGGDPRMRVRANHGP